MYWRIFGGPAIDRDDADGRLNVPLTSMQARLVGILLARVNQPVDVTRLIHDCWAGSPPDRADVALRMQVARIRKRLADGSGDPHALVTEPHSYRLSIADDEIDVHRFETIVGRAALEMDDDARLGLLEQALTIARGEPFGAFADETWAVAVTQHWRDRRLSVEEDRFDVLIGMGRLSQAADELAQAITEHPYRERRWAQRMLALYRSGRQADALRAFHHARTALIEDLGIEPGRELRALEAAILRHDPRLSTHPLGRASTTLPAPAGRVLGRDGDIDAVVRQLERNRLVTITGLPGVGKSCVASAVAQHIGEQGVNVVFVELGTSSGNTTPLETIARTLGIGLTEEREPIIAAVRESVSPHPVLLLLDECEAGRDELESLVSVLIATCPRLRILATSRHPIGARREVVIPLGPLDVGSPERPGPAAQLLADCLGFDLDGVGDHARSTIVELAERAGGLPLAIELAVPLIGDAALIDHILELSPAATMPTDALIDSVRAAEKALPKGARRLLRNSHELPAGFDLDAATTLTGGSREQAARAIGALIRFGLVTPHVENTFTRYRVPDSVRRAAAEMVGAAEAAIALETAVGYGTALGRRVGTGLVRPALEHLGKVEVELDNLRHLVGRTVGSTEGLTLVVSLAQSCRELGLTTEATRWLEEHLEATDHADPLLRGFALAHLIDMPGYFASYGSRTDLIAEVESIAREHGDERLLLAALAFRAIAVGWHGDIDAAQSILSGREAVALIESIGDPWLAAHRDRLLGLVPMMTGDFASACSEQVRCAETFLSLGDPSGAVSAFFNGATAARMAAMPDGALELLHRARDLAGTGGARSIQPLVSYELAQSARARGRCDAIDLMRVAIDELTVVGNLRSGGTARHDLGLWLIEDGRSEDGSAMLLDAVRVLCAYDDRAAAPALAELARCSDCVERRARLAGAAYRASSSGQGPHLSADERTKVETLAAKARSRHRKQFELGLGSDVADVVGWAEDVVDAMRRACSA